MKIYKYKINKKYDYEIFVYFSFNEWLHDYVNIWKNEFMGVNFNDDFYDFISWFLYILNENGLNKISKISLWCFDDKFVLYLNNKKYDYFHGWS